MTRRFLLIAFFLSAAAVARISPAAAVPQDPALFIRGLGNRALAVLSPNVNQNVREARFQQLYEQYFDAPRIARFVLGRYWWLATPDQRRQFRKLFEKYVVFAYSARLSAYSGETLRVLGSRPEGKGFLVASEIIHPGGEPPIKVLWRLHREGDDLKIVDVIVEGISMAVTQRQEFASVIARNGGNIGALLAVMQRKIEQAAG
jgi:phospholipid transport system substrate-binding protein